MRECTGKLGQIDGSEHAWFENRGKTCTLLVFVDDAPRRRHAKYITGSSELMALHFVGPEDTVDYFQVTRAYLETNGKLSAFYNDKHGVFRVNAKGAAGINVYQVVGFGPFIIIPIFFSKS